MKSENIKEILLFISGFCFLVFLVIVLSLLVLPSYPKKKNQQDVSQERIIFYQEGMNKYEVHQEESNIEVFVEEQVECIKSPCNPIHYQFSISFSEEGKKEALRLIDSLFQGEEKEITITKDQLSETDQKVWNSILTNEEWSSSAKKLYFSIQSARIDCDTVILKLYEDQTYEYIYGSKNGTLVSKTGTYSLPISFLEDSRNEIPDSIGPYRITFPSGEEKFLYDNTSSIHPFFTNLGINPDTCLELF